jgi:hypothetical protein
MTVPVTEPKKEKTWLILISVLAQQLCLFAFLFCYPMLMYVSIWVVRVPVAIIWVMSFVLPLVYVRPISSAKYLRLCAKSGWLYVLAGLTWISAYVWFSGRDGTPVSWDAVERHYHAQPHP